MRSLSGYLSHGGYIVMKEHSILAGLGQFSQVITEVIFHFCLLLLFLTM